VWVNPYNVSAALPESLEPQQHPDVVLKDAREVVIEDKPGDLVMFRGSAMWHLRRNPARAVNLYLKLNDFNCDPLGEDPETPARRERTLAAVRNGFEAERVVPMLSRRVDLLSRQYTRDWQELLQASVWNEPPVPLSRLAWDLLQAVDGRRTVAEVAVEVSNGSDREAVEVELRRLAERGVIELAG
jgi:hypothetical protein